MADDDVTVRPIRAIVQGSSTFYLDHFAPLNPLREPRTAPIFELGVVVAHLSVCLAISNAASDGRSHDGRAAETN
jgi:hypothetical protein